MEQQLDTGAMVGLCMARIWLCAQEAPIPYGAGQLQTLQGAASWKRCWEVSFTCTSEPDGDQIDKYEITVSSLSSLLNIMGHAQGARGRIWSVPVTFAACIISPAAACS